MSTGLHYLGCQEDNRFLFEAHGPGCVRDVLLSFGLSRPVVARLFAQRQVTRLSDQSPLVPSSSLGAGEGIAVVVSHPSSCSLPTRRLSDLERIYEDDFLIAVNKPAGLLVHGDGTGSETLTDHVRAYLLESGRPADPQAIQRLDVDTTGVVLFCKVREFQGLFDALVAGEEDGHARMRKRYLVVVDGCFEQECCDFYDPIARDRHDAHRMRVAGSGQGLNALTHVRRLAVLADGTRSVLLAELGTGRRHQIRVHLAAHGHPVTNDPLYGAVASGEGLMLHAFQEEFTHPITREHVLVQAPWPDRFPQLDVI